MSRNSERSKKIKRNTVKLVALGLMIALQVVLSRFLSINLQFLKIGFSFIPIMFSGYLYGASGGVIVATVSDLIGALLFPSGAFFPGFTVTAALSGLIYGVSVSGNCTTAKIVSGVITEQLVCSLLLNTWWLSIMYGSSFKTLLLTRVWQIMVMIFVEIVFAEIFFRRLSVVKKLKQYLLPGR